MRIKLSSTVILTALVVLVSWALVTPVYGQVLYGSITGHIVDASGGAVPGADVRVVNNATNFSTGAVTNDTGVYLIRNVPAGQYTLRISLPGFKEHVSQNVIVSVGEVTRENVTLQVGEITDEVTVLAATTVLQTDTSEVRTHLEDTAVQNLPLNIHRNYQSLIRLVPGTVPSIWPNPIPDRPERSLATRVNGGTHSNNNTRIDGAQSVNVWLPHNTSYVPPSETIETVNITTNSFDAEKGFAGGAAITLITKSGTNELRGSVFGYHENSALSAREFFNFVDRDGDGKADPPAGRRTFTGFTLGGPISRDRLFVFGGWEALFQGLALTDLTTVATADQRRGDFSAFLPTSMGGSCTSGCAVIYDPRTGHPDGSGRQPFPNNIIPQERMAQAPLIMQDHVPLPNLPGLNDNYEVSGNQVLDRHNIDFKMDWHRTDEHRIWGKYARMFATVHVPPRFGEIGGGRGIGNTSEGVSDTVQQIYTFGHNWAFTPLFLLDGNFSLAVFDQEILTQDMDLGNFGQEVLGLPGTNAAAGQEQACIVDGVNRCGGVPRFSVAGFTTIGRQDPWYPLFRDENSYTFTQNFSWIRGNHDIRWGYDLVHHQLEHWQPEVGAGPRGRFDFNRQMTGLLGGPTLRDQNAYAAFLLGQPSSAGKSLQWELLTGREWQHAWFLRDRWQLTPKLTLNIGLRYEFYPLVKRADRPMEILDLNTFDVIFSNNTEVSKRLLAPRLGFAYRATDRDVIRSGYGITYNPFPFTRPLRGRFPLTIAADFEQSNPFDPFRSLSEGIPLFAGPDLSAGSALLPPTVAMTTMPADKIQRGYTQSWNLTYERKFPAEFVVSFGYVGTQTVRQSGTRALNWSPAGGGTSGRQLFPLSTTGISLYDGFLSANYHSLQTAVNRRFVNGLFVKGSYTFSRTINWVDNEGGGMDWNDPALMDRNRAEAGFSVPHNLQVATIYELPFGRSGNSIAHKIVQGWQLNGIFSWNSGSPFTVGSSSGPLNARDNDQTADQVKPTVEKLGGIGRGDPYYDRSAFAEPNRIPGVECTNVDCYGTSGRNILRGPSWVNLDFSVFRDFPFSEQVGLEFRGEFLNLTNTPHFNNPSSSVSSGSFMWITSTSQTAPERIIRFGLKLKF